MEEILIGIGIAAALIAVVVVVGLIIRKRTKAKGDPTKDIYPMW